MTWWGYGGWFQMGPPRSSRGSYLSRARLVLLAGTRPGQYTRAGTLCPPSQVVCFAELPPAGEQVSAQHPAGAGKAPEPGASLGKELVRGRDGVKYPKGGWFHWAREGEELQEFFKGKRKRKESQLLGTGLCFSAAVGDEKCSSCQSHCISIHF